MDTTFGPSVRSHAWYLVYLFSSMRKFFQKFDLSQAGRYLVTLRRQRLCFSSVHLSSLSLSLPPSLSPSLPLRFTRQVPSYHYQYQYHRYHSLSLTSTSTVVWSYIVVEQDR